MTRHASHFQSTVAAIPCGVHITSPGFPRWTGSAFSCPSAADYYGEAPSFLILDRKGYEAPWLEAKLTQPELARIEQECINYLKQDDYYAPDY